MQNYKSKSSTRFCSGSSAITERKKERKASNEGRKKESEKQNPGTAGPQWFSYKPNDVRYRLANENVITAYIRLNSIVLIHKAEQAVGYVAGLFDINTVS